MISELFSNVSVCYTAFCSGVFVIFLNRTNLFQHMDLLIIVSSSCYTSAAFLVIFWIPRLPKPFPFFRASTTRRAHTGSQRCCGFKHQTLIPERKAAHTTEFKVPYACCFSDLPFPQSIESLELSRTRGLVQIFTENNFEKHARTAQRFPLQMHFLTLRS